MIEYRFATEHDVENMVEAIYDIWLNQEEGSVEDAIEVSEGLAYYYRNFQDYVDRVVLAIDTDTGGIAGLAGYLEHPLLELPHVKAVQMNPVGVRKEYRRRGIARNCSDFLCNHLKENGYAFILVCGVPHLYPYIGYHQVFPFTKAEFDAPFKFDSSEEIFLKKANIDTIFNILDIHRNAEKGNLFAMERSEVWLDRKFFFQKYKIKDFAPQVPLGAIDINRVYFAMQKDACIGYILLKRADTEEVNMEELYAVDDTAVSSMLKEIQTLFETKRISVHHCSIGSSIYETAVKYGKILSFDSALYIKVLDTKKLIYGMKQVFEKRLNENISDKELEKMCEMLDALSEEQKASVLAGKGSYKEVAEYSAVNMSETDLEMMELCFPKHSPYVLEPDMN